MQEIPIELEPISGSLEYPLVATIPLPKEWEKDVANLRLLEKNKVIVADIIDVWRWDDGSIRWLHVIANFKWNNGGQPEKYKLVKSTDPSPSSEMSISVSSDQIVLYTGLNRIQIDKPFQGIFIDNSEPGGIHLIDELEIQWHSKNDDISTVLEVVSVGSAHATIKVSGWLQNPEKRVRPFIKYSTFITAYHNSPLVKIDHACTFADDMRKHGVRCLSFILPENAEHILTRSLQEKVPNVLVNKILYQWPGYYVPFDYEDVELDQVYKFKYLTKGPILQNSLPNEYRQAFEEQEDTTECEPQYIAASNLEGVSMRNELALLLTNENTSAIATMYENEQRPSPTKTEMCNSLAWDLLASVEDDYPEQEKSVRDGQLGQYNSIDRYEDYGWHIYGNIPSHEVMSESRPSLHRIWFNAHYMHICTLWEQWLRSRDQEALQIARIATDNYCSIALTRYDSYQGYYLGDFTHRDDVPTTKSHAPGSLWHVKGLIPWGGRGYGMDKMDSDAGTRGHWMDPHCMLMSWLIDRDYWALDGYETWYKARDEEGWYYQSSVREVNTTLVNNIRAYEWLPSTANYEAISQMVDYIMSRGPLTSQASGPLWEPSWLRRAVHFFPDNVELKQYVLDSVQAENLKWWLDISACAYELTQDPTYLEKFGGPFFTNGKHRVFQDDTGKWDKYGFGSYDSNRWTMQWGRFLKVVRDSGVEITERPDPGNYLLANARWNHQNDALLRGSKIKIYKDTSDSITIPLEMQVLGGGDIQATGLWCYGPEMDLLWHIDRLQVSTVDRVYGHRETGWPIYVEPEYSIDDPRTGVFTLAFGTHAAQLFMPINNQGKDECLIVQNKNVTGWSEEVFYNMMFCNAYLIALTDQPVAINFKEMSDVYPAYVSLKSVDSDEFFFEKWLVAGEEVNVTVNMERLHVQIFAYRKSWTQIQFDSLDGNEDLYLMGNNLEMLERIKMLINA